MKEHHGVAMLCKINIVCLSSSLVGLFFNLEYLFTLYFLSQTEQSFFLAKLSFINMLLSSNSVTTLI